MTIPMNLGTAPSLEPVLLELRQHHAYKHPGKGRRGCAFEPIPGQVCRAARYDVAHLGAPTSMRGLGSGNELEYQAMKRSWQQLFAEQLDDLGPTLPRPVSSVLVEGMAIFPDRRKRDQGNHRMIVEKALGDALVHGSPEGWANLRWARGHVLGGWLIDDDWSRYEFGRLQARYEHGVGGLELMLFPGALG